MPHFIHQPPIRLAALAGVVGAVLSPPALAGPGAIAGQGLGTSAWRQIEGRVQLELRRSPSLQGVGKVASTLSKLGLPTVPRPGIGLLLASPKTILGSRPAIGDKSSDFGRRRDPIRRRRVRFHKGIDFQGKRGDPVFAAGPGVVTRARRVGGYGRVVFIDHGGGLETRYAHLHRIHVKRGDFVPAGALIGKVGSTGRSTGPHLHFEVRRGGQPKNPERFIDTAPLGAGLVSRLMSMFERKDERVARNAGEYVPRSRASRALW